MPSYCIVVAITQTMHYPITIVPNCFTGGKTGYQTEVECVMLCNAIHDNSLGISLLERVLIVDFETTRGEGRRGINSIKGEAAILIQSPNRL